MISVRPQRKNARNVVVTYACPKKHHSSIESGLVRRSLNMDNVWIRKRCTPQRLSSLISNLNVVGDYTVSDYTVS